MRILLIAYEFPPSPSPQSLRWAYLGRELACAGHEVHVLTTDPAWSAPGLPDLPEQVRVHRVFGGPITGVLAMLARRHEARLARTRAGAALPEERKSSAAVAVTAVPVEALRESRLNWKGRLVDRLKRLATALVFPDARGEWYFPARRVIDRLVAEIAPEVIVSSHEPATTLELGLRLKRRHGIPWLADLGDPVLADYTPRRWRPRAGRLEKQVMKHADGITVTAPGTRDLLLERHGPPAAGRDGMVVLTQGYDDRDSAFADLPAGFFDPGRLELLYTGSFYQFRRPDALLDAVSAVPGIRLNVASSVIPDWLRPRFEAEPEKFRLLGFMPHRGVLAVQRQADVLVNIANDNPCQVPGKIYEYLGAGRPILHTGNVVEEDVSAALIRGRRRGWVCGSRGEAETLLRRVVASKQAGYLLEVDGLDLGDRAVAEFGWSRLAQRLAGVLAQLVANGRPIPRLPVGQEY